MTKKRAISITIGLLAIAFVVFVLSYWRYINAAEQAEIDNYAKIVAVSLWTLEPKAPTEYLRQASKSRNYQRLVISHQTGETFIEIDNELQGGLDRLFRALNIIRPVELRAKITYQGEELGWITAVWYPRTIYTYLYALAVAGLLIAAHWFLLGALEVKRELESRVSQRTSELERANQELQEEIAERQRAERALRISEERYRDLFHSITDFIYAHDLEGRLLTINPAAAASLGYTPQEMVGRKISRFMIEKYRRAFETDYLSRIKEEGRFDGVSVYLAKDGSKHYIEYRNTLVVQEGREPYVTGSGRDVTERVRAEKELRRLEEELAQAHKMEAIGALAGGVAHDFNNLLQAMSGYVQMMMLDDELGERHKQRLTQIEKAIDRATALVRQLLTFSRKMEPRLKPMDLNYEVEQAANILERTIPKMIRIETRLADDLKTIHGDPNQLAQVLMNLATNARDAMPDGGSLIFETRNVTLTEGHFEAQPNFKPGEYVLLQVTDTGLGMDKETASRIFEPFYTTKEVGQGTGLGLAIVYGIVKGHNGHIVCQTKPGRGTSFLIYLPAAAEDGAGVAIDEVEVELTGGRETILLVDDEPAILETGVSILGHYGYTTITAASGEEACRIYEQDGERIDLVLLDLGMPGMGGYKCLEELLKLDPEVKVIIASGYAAEGRAAECLAAGAADFVGKPYRLVDLLSKVRAILDV